MSRLMIACLAATWLIWGSTYLVIGTLMLLAAVTGESLSWPPQPLAAWAWALPGRRAKAVRYFDFDCR